MEVCVRSSWLLLLGVIFLSTTLQGVQGHAESEGPSESECRPYIEKALRELEHPGAEEASIGDSNEIEHPASIEEELEHPVAEEASIGEELEPPVAEEASIGEELEHPEVEEASIGEDLEHPGAEEASIGEELEPSGAEEASIGEELEPLVAEEASIGEELEHPEVEEASVGDSKENEPITTEDELTPDDKLEPEAVESIESIEVDPTESVDEKSKESVEDKEESTEQQPQENDHLDDETVKEESTEKEAAESAETPQPSQEIEEPQIDPEPQTVVESIEQEQPESAEEIKQLEPESESIETTQEIEKEESKELVEPQETSEVIAEQSVEESIEDVKITENQVESSESDPVVENTEEAANASVSDESVEQVSDETAPVEEELTNEVEIPENLRSREHVESLLKLDQEATESERIIDSMSEITLRELKKLYENAIKPLEIVYKYRDLSNRHFGDSEIFSKPLILFMGPWSGGKSSIINYLVDIEYNETSLKTGAEPSPAYFNILMHGEDIEILEGTELAADYTFSGLQKFGQGLEERLRGFKLPSKLLEKVNIVEIPGILEVRKQVSRVFPFNDACQWFIDRADVIFLVYDPSKLDVGPETEAILDQLKGREYQTRIILNKADQVKPEELMRVQGALIWNISPLMSSPQPPMMYTTSLWSKPYESWAPVRLLQAQERSFLRDIRSAIDRRIENKIASARRFAVRVRNHAKMVDCYLTTYYNHKSIFGNRKQVSDQIIEHPQDYHIYEGLSTLTNISRYDLPDPDVYKDFFRLNPLYEFQQLSATCTYFRGCPINKLDIAIAYDLPELLGKHKKNVEAALAEASQNQAKKKS